MSIIYFIQVFYGIPFQKGDRILTSVHEYAANYIAYLQVSRSLELAFYCHQRAPAHCLCQC